MNIINNIICLYVLVEYMYIVYRQVCHRISVTYCLKIVLKWLYLVIILITSKLQIPTKHIIIDWYKFFSKFNR